MTVSVKGITGPVLGKFRVSALSGLVAGVAANAPIFSARFAPAWVAAQGVRAAIVDIRLKAQIITPFTNANEITASCFFARSFTASDTGGTSVLPTGISGMIESFADGPLGINTSTFFTDMRISTTAALTAGTRTLDANPFLSLVGAQTLAAANANQNVSLEADFTPNSDTRWAIVLQGQTNGVATNAEGIVVTVPFAQGAGGSVRYTVEMEWYEYAGSIFTAQSMT